ncbi:unnamed protein product [Lampetra planeri]
MYVRGVKVNRKWQTRRRSPHRCRGAPSPGGRCRAREPASVASVPNGVPVPNGVRVSPSVPVPRIPRRPGFPRTPESRGENEENLAPLSPRSDLRPSAPRVARRVPLARPSMALRATMIDGAVTAAAARENVHGGVREMDVLRGYSPIAFALRSRSVDASPNADKRTRVEERQ